MWISKKKLAEIEREQYVKALRQEMQSSTEIEQDQRIRDLEKQVKKLKKIVREGY
jgi:hypothetical protein